MPAQPQQLTKELHLSMATVSRGAGQSVVARSNYQQRAQGRDERTGRFSNYSRKAPPAFTFVKGWKGSHIELWNAVERVEDRLANKPDQAQTAYSIDLALPREVDRADNEKLLVKIATWIHAHTGAPVSLAEHLDDPDNPHAHFLIAQRAFDQATGVWAKKKFDFFNKWRGGDGLDQLRAHVAALFNDELSVYAPHVKIEHESFAKRGVKREAEKHVGPRAHYVKEKEETKAKTTGAKGEVYQPDFPDRVAANQRIRARNRLRKEREETPQEPPVVAARPATPATPQNPSNEAMRHPPINTTEANMLAVPAVAPASPMITPLTESEPVTPTPVERRRIGSRIEPERLAQQAAANAAAKKAAAVQQKAENIRQRAAEQIAEVAPQLIVLSLFDSLGKGPRR